MIKVFCFLYIDKPKLQSGNTVNIRPHPICVSTEARLRILHKVPGFVIDITTGSFLCGASLCLCQLSLTSLRF